MFPFYTLVTLMVQSFLSLLFNWLFWAIVLLVAMMYKRIAGTSRRLFNIPAEPLWPSVLMATVFGIAGGFIGSILLTIAGISVFEIGISYLWIAAVLLMLIQQRFLCFAYAGGLLSLSKLLFGFPLISVAQVMGLVAILHMVEAVLILCSGHLEAVPVYVRTKQGQIVGGYNLQKFWPLPLVALAAWIVPSEEIIQGAVAMPDWWPLIKTELLSGQGETLYMMMPVVAALGYGDIALTALPQEKTRRAALELGGYSIILFLLAVAASNVPQLAILAALFGPLGHELLIQIGQRREIGGKPIFVQPEHGVMVLHVLRNSPLKAAGVRNGDIILSVNGSTVDDSYELRTALLEAGEEIELEYLIAKTKTVRRARLTGNTEENLRFIPAPGRYENSFIEVSGSSSILQKWLFRLRRIIKRRWGK